MRKAALGLGAAVDQKRRARPPRTEVPLSTYGQQLPMLSNFNCRGHCHYGSVTFNFSVKTRRRAAFSMEAASHWQNT